VVLGGRTAQRLAAAARELGPAASWRTVDITDRASSAAFFAPLERVDHLFTSATSYRVGPMPALSDEDAESPFVSKFWGQHQAVRHVAPKPAVDGSVVLMSGAAGARRPPRPPTRPATPRSRGWGAVWRSSRRRSGSTSSRPAP
jgi:NADP-dependent 3-hydroxy acid dehydrogenase YdfG